jgi:hypothetical protein
LIKGGKKFFFQGNPKADQLAHRHSPFRGVLKKAAVPTPELPAFVAEATSAE